MKTAVKCKSNTGSIEHFRKRTRDRVKRRSKGIVVSYTGTQDSELIAKHLDRFVFEPSRKAEVQKKYDSFKKKYIKVYD